MCRTILYRIGENSPRLEVAVESTLFSLVNEQTVGHHAVGAIGYRHSGGGFHGSLLHDFELLVILLCSSNEVSMRTEHCIRGNLQYQILYVTTEDLGLWVAKGEHKEIIQCFLEGEIIWDGQGRVANLRSQIMELEQTLQEQSMFREFSRFLRRYLEAKSCSEDGYYMDAYRSVLDALYHYACIELIEQRIQPSQYVWDQISHKGSVVYKLYEELTESQETLEQRVKLALLACDFSVMSKMASSCKFLLNILSSRHEPWSIQELCMHPDLVHVREELPMLLRKLVYRSLVRETPSGHQGNGSTVRQIRYWAN